MHLFGDRVLDPDHHFEVVEFLDRMGAVVVDIMFALFQRDPSCWICDASLCDNCGHDNLYPEFCIGQLCLAAGAGRRHFGSV